MDVVDGGRLGHWKEMLEMDDVWMLVGMDGC